jgi:hypothetical protein
MDIAWWILFARLTIRNILNLILININGSTLNIWNNEDYVKSWILNHRTADDNRSRKINRNEKESFK